MASRSMAVLTLVVFASACATPRMVRLDTGQGEPLEHLPPTTNHPMAVGEEDFEESLARLMLQGRLVVRSAGQGLVVRASFSPPAGDTGYWLGKALGGPCRPGQPRHECMSLLDDVMGRGTMGGATWLAGRLPLLPHFAEASAAGATQVGVNLASVGEVTSVAVVEGNLVISLAPTAVAMAITGSGNGGNAPGFSAFKSFDSFKRAMGPAGFKKQWHHIVEQTEGNIARFGPEAIHNTRNVISLDEALHRNVSRLYSQIRKDITGSEALTVRKWLSTQSMEEQHRFGLQAIENVQKGLWP